MIYKAPFNFDIRKLSNLGTVGSVETIAFPTCAEEVQKAFQYAKDNGLRAFVLGGGTNTLIGHLKDTMIISDRDYKSSWVTEGDRIVVSSNHHIHSLITKAATLRFYGLEFLAGIPAHLGGLIYMNAGAYERNISDFIESVHVVDESGEREISDLKFSYRKSSINGFISKVCFKLNFEESDDYQEVIKGRIEHFVNDRESKHPLHQPSLGCFFKNTETQSAGYLIDKSGLKGFRVGGAVVSEKHANFFINAGDARFEDFIELIDIAKERVYKSFNVELDLEVKVVDDSK